MFHISIYDRGKLVEDCGLCDTEDFRKILRRSSNVCYQHKDGYNLKVKTPDGTYDYTFKSKEMFLDIFRKLKNCMVIQGEESSENTL